ncbi:MAG: hypothetical protein GX279_09525 [Clostridiaceae bacterium]|nr:hypothetical protein [Clostridiaceae bacterium]
MPRFIVLDPDNKVIAIHQGSTAVGQEIESETGELGQIMQLDGTFITPEIPSEPATPTVEDMLAELKAQNEELRQQNLILMDALATVYETILMGGS